jgi:hypothetical protein
MSMSIELSVFDALRLCGIIASIGVFVSTLEDLCTFHHFKDNGILSWKISKLREKRTAGGVMADILDQFLTVKRYRFVLLTTLMASAIMPATVFLSQLLSPLCLIILVGIILMEIRNIYGLNGSDHMNLITFSAILIGSSVPSGSLAQQASIWFVALQYALAMLIAGAAKVTSGTWRSGIALPNIMSIAYYGNNTLYRILVKHDNLSKVLCWSVIIVECSFWMIFLTQGTTSIIFLSVGFMLHASIAVLMGLNDFFWAFIAPYPAIWFCLQQIR